MLNCVGLWLRRLYRSREDANSSADSPHGRILPSVHGWKSFFALVVLKTHSVNTL